MSDKTGERQDNHSIDDIGITPFQSEFKNEFFLAIDKPKIVILKREHEIFCQELVKSGNATAAYKAAYDTGGQAEKTIQAHACRLKNKGKVRARLAQIWQGNFNEKVMGKEELIQRLTEWARGNSKINFSAAKLLTEVYGLIDNEKGLNIPLKALKSGNIQLTFVGDNTDDNDRKLMQEVVENDND